MGAVVALDVRTGDVLALVSKPSFDPNDFAGGIDADDLEGSSSTDEWRPLQNRAIAGQYPPGSTYKAIVAAAALEEGADRPEPQGVLPRLLPARPPHLSLLEGEAATARSTCTARWSSRATSTSTTSASTSASIASPTSRAASGSAARTGIPLRQRAGRAGPDQRLEGAPLRGAVDARRDGVGVDRAGLQPGDAAPARGRVRARSPTAASWCEPRLVLRVVDPDGNVDRGARRPRSLGTAPVAPRAPGARARGARGRRATSRAAPADARACRASASPARPAPRRSSGSSTPTISTRTRCGCVTATTRGSSATRRRSARESWWPRSSSTADTAARRRRRSCRRCWPRYFGVSRRRRLRRRRRPLRRRRPRSRQADDPETAPVLVPETPDTPEAPEDGAAPADTLEGEDAGD